MVQHGYSPVNSGSGSFTTISRSLGTLQRAVIRFTAWIVRIRRRIPEGTLAFRTIPWKSPSLVTPFMPTAFTGEHWGDSLVIKVFYLASLPSSASTAFYARTRHLSPGTVESGHPPTGREY